MGLWKSIKDFGSKLIRKIVKPKLPKLDPNMLKALKIRTGPRPVIAPNPNAGQNTKVSNTGGGLNTAAGPSKPA